MYKSTKLQTSHVQEYKTANLSCTRVQNYKPLMYKSTKLQTSHVQEYKLQATNFSFTNFSFTFTISLILRNYKAPNLLYTRVQNYQTTKPIFYKTI